MVGIGVFDMRTVGQILDQRRGIGPGFDFLRIALAVLILFTHSTDIVTGEYGEYAAGVWQIPVRSLVPMFFALSRFLITGSAQRLRLKDFILNRAMRIVPALFVDIVVAACIIGPIFTTLSLRDYVTSPVFWLYFTNITGVINYTLPGVFTHNINPSVVNGSLWTVPFEIGCYVIMSVIIVSGLLTRRLALATLSGFFCVVVLAAVIAFGRLLPVPASTTFHGGFVGVISNFTVNKAGYYLYFYFLAGCMAYLFREKIPFSWPIMLSCIFIFSAISLSGSFYAGLMLTKILVLIPVLTYATVFIGMLAIPKLPLYHRGDYSYGIYLYGFPLQQALIASFPGHFTIATHFIASLVLATLVAMVSWHGIEKPTLRLRRKFSFTARKTDPEINQHHTEPEPGSVLKQV